MELHDSKLFLLEVRWHGVEFLYRELLGKWHHRFLSVNGRWSSSGSLAEPLIAWPTESEAHNAAKIARELRQDPEMGVTVVPRARVKSFVPFREELRPALGSYLPLSAADARVLESDRLKVNRFAAALIAAWAKDSGSNIDPLIETAAANCNEHYPGATLASAARFVSSEHAAQVVARMIDGELPCEEWLPPSTFVVAVSLARRMPDLEQRVERKIAVPAIHGVVASQR